MSIPRLVSNPEAVPDPGLGGVRWGDDGIERRLRQLENRMARLEIRFEHMPTKEDLESIKTMLAGKTASNIRWMLGVMIAAMASVIGAFIKTFMGQANIGMHRRKPDRTAGALPDMKLGICKRPRNPTEKRLATQNLKYGQNADGSQEQSVY